MNVSHQQRACLLGCLSVGRLRPEALRYIAANDTQVAQGQIHYRKTTVDALIEKGLMQRLRSSLHPSRWPAVLTPLGELHARQLRANDLATQADALAQEAMA